MSILYWFTDYGIIIIAIILAVALVWGWLKLREMEERVARIVRDHRFDPHGKPSTSIWGSSWIVGGPTRDKLSWISRDVELLFAHLKVEKKTTEKITKLVPIAKKKK